jgi:Protein of unknown function (DUF2568)
MANNPLNLGLRFLLELAGLAALGLWGWSLGGGALRFVWAILFPLVGAALWGVFRVPNDGGRPVVHVPGVARLALEVVYFGAATWGLRAAVSPGAAWVFGGVVLLHYLTSYDRLLWLVRQ